MKTTKNASKLYQNLFKEEKKKSNMVVNIIKNLSKDEKEKLVEYGQNILEW